MEILENVLVVAHFIGMASLLGGVLVQIQAMRSGTTRVLRIMMDGAWTQLVTGLALVAVAQWTEPGEIDNAKIAVKLVVLLFITVVAFVNRKKEHPAAWIVPTIGALTLVNIVIAVFWN